MFAFAAALIAAIPAPVVKVVLVVPGGQKPWSDAQRRLTPALKDVQWWYSCQMEAYGYGAKTFGLELDRRGNVIVHVAPLRGPISLDRGLPPSNVIASAESILGDVKHRRGAVMLIFYNGYYWTDQEKNQVLPAGDGKAGEWTHLTAWHYFSINPKGWNVQTPVPQLPIENSYFPALHTLVLQAFTADGTRTVAERTSVAYSSIMHNLGHAFGLEHSDPTDHPKGDVMSGDYWHARGNFQDSIKGEWCCLTGPEAAILNKNPLFAVRKGLKASTGAKRETGKRNGQ